MSHRVFHTLVPVRRRQQWLAALRGLVWGIVAGSVLVIGLEALRRGLGWWYTPWPSAAALVGAAVTGALTGLSLTGTWEAAAAAVDAHYRLKDRAASALEFARQPELSPAQVLAVADADAHLSAVEPSRVAPIRLPRGWRRAIPVLAIALVVIVWPSSLPEGQAALSQPLAPIVRQAEELREDFKQLEELVKDEEDPELEQLVEKLVEHAEQMKEPGVDVKEALAQLSEMQAAIMQQQAQYAVAAVDEQLAALGEAMASIASLEQAGAALQQGDLDKAAKELEAAEVPPLDPRKREEAQQKLKEIAKSMKSAGMGQLANATSELSDAIGSGGGKGQSGKSLANCLRKHQKRKGIDKWMMQELARLSECKSECSECKGDKLCKSCKGGGCGSCNGSGKNGGNGTAQSDKPSSNWGRGSSGNPAGDPTQLDANRQVVNITGQHGEGPTDIETTHSPEGRQQAGRTYKELYNNYRKLSDAVLENEPIPLGHRQTIRRYFESIRPDETSTPAAEPQE